MTLHEAIIKVLAENKNSMTTQKIADLLNKSKWYEKKDGSLITAFQIHGRTRKYSHLFDRKGNIVILKVISGLSKNSPVQLINEHPPKVDFQNSVDSKELEKYLFNSDNYIDANTIDEKVPSVPGIYCIRIKNKDSIPAPFNEHLKKRNHNIIYIGIATESLNTRFLNQELRARGHGTFFRSLGAILGFLPIKGSLKNHSNKRNYKFNKGNESTIINWINTNLVVNWIEFAGDFENMESYLIRKYLPLINLAKNPVALNEISELRAKCVEYANS